MTKISFLVFLLYLNVTNINTARILAVFPTPSISHQVVFRKLIEGLTRRGHEVTVITTDAAYSPGQAPTNLKEIDVHDLSYKIWREELNKTSVGSRDDLFDQINVVYRAITKVFKIQLATKQVREIVNKKTGEYDLLLLEAWVRPTLIFSNIYKIPIIQVSSFGAMPYNSRDIGAPQHPLLYPSQLCQKLYNLTIWDKFEELYRREKIEAIREQTEREDDDTLKSIFGPGTPSIKKLANNVHMLFLNIHPIWAGNPPVPSSVVYMGGIHMNPPKELPKNLQTYLDLSKNGVIYFSLGTNVDPSLLPPEKIQILIKVFSELPYDVLWKWSKDELPGRSENIKIFKWIPQSDLLRHPKIKVFITQGGLQSTDEAIKAGVPLIGIPMLGDQWCNVEKYVYHNIGVRLDLPTLSENAFRNAIVKVIGDKSFRENIIKLRTLMEDQPQSALERAVWWTEHVLRHGGAKHLQAAGANITWAEYIELELVIIVSLVLLSILSLSYILISRLLILIKKLIKYFNVKVKIA